MSTEDQNLALAAASQASEAVAELLRFAREGEGLHSPFEIGVVEKLVDALKIAIEVDGLAGQGDDERDRLYGALVPFLKEWA